MVGRDLRPVPSPELALSWDPGGASAEFCGLGDQPLVLRVGSIPHINLNVLDVDHIEYTPEKLPCPWRPVAWDTAPGHLTKTTSWLL